MSQDQFFQKRKERLDGSSILQYGQIHKYIISNGPTKQNTLNNNLQLLRKDNTESMVNEDLSCSMSMSLEKIIYEKSKLMMQEQSQANSMSQNNLETSENFNNSIRADNSWQVLLTDSVVQANKIQPFSELQSIKEDNESWNFNDFDQIPFVKEEKIQIQKYILKMMGIEDQPQKLSWTVQECLRHLHSHKNSEKFQ